MLGVLKPCQGGDPIPLEKSEVLIGRKPFCDITIGFANVSSRHCQLEFREGFWFARDLDSTNGTSIDGKTCRDDCVKPGSVLGIGRHRFTLEYEAQGPAPAELLVDDVAAVSLMDQAGIEQVSSSKTEESRSTARQPAKRGHLVPIGGGVPVILSSDHLIVGRDRSCDIRLPLSAVSSRHCELELVEFYWLARDLGSRNGTIVDGKKIEQKWLFPKSELKISTARFKILYTPPADAPRPKEEGASFTRSLLERAGLQRRR